MRHEQKCEASSDSSDPDGDGVNSSDEDIENNGGAQMLNELGVEALGRKIEANHEDKFGLNRRTDYTIDNP